MIAYGYKWDSPQKNTDKLRETSLVCTRRELDLLIEYLSDVRKEITDMGELEGEHWHYRDWDEAWTEEQSDFIIFLDSCEQ